MVVDPANDSMRISPVAAPVRGQVVSKLQQALREGRFKAGDRLIDREICDLTGASRTSVREALRQLEAEGLVETVPHRGTVVASLDAKQASDIYRVRAQLEGLAARLFAENASGEQRGILHDGFEKLREAYRTEDLEVMLAAKRRFYDALLQGADNQLLVDVLQRLYARVHQLRALSLSQPDRSRESLSELDALVAAIDAGDSNRAEEAASQHVKAAHVALVRALS